MRETDSPTENSNAKGTEKVTHCANDTIVDGLQSQNEHDNGKHSVLTLFLFCCVSKQGY